MQKYDGVIHFTLGGLYEPLTVAHPILTWATPIKNAKIAEMLLHNVIEIWCFNATDTMEQSIS